MIIDAMTRFILVLTSLHFNHSLRGYQQQDAHEFLIYLLDQLNFELSKTSKSSSKVAELFGGILQSDVSR